MLTVNEVAQRLNIAQSTVYQLIDVGKIAVHRIGTGRGTLRVSEEDFQAYLASCRDHGRTVAKRLRRAKLKHLRT